MTKSRHLSVLLFAPVLFVCGHAGRVDVAESPDAGGLRTGLSAGPRTKLRQNVKRIYTHELGVREATGRNDGPQVAKYLRYTGLDEGYAWCVGFVDRWEDKYLITVEGNTNAPGARSREGVYRKRRLRSSIYQVADFIDH